MATYSVVADIDSTMEATNPDLNSGSNALLGCTLFFIGGDKIVFTRTILNFDLSGFPGDWDDVTAAKLTVDVAERFNTGKQVDFNRCTRPADWVESEVTWNDYKSATAWTAAGGDFTVTDQVITTVPVATGVLDITGFLVLVQDAHDNRADILSLIQKFNDEADDDDSRFMNLRSSEATTGTKPTLVITFGVESVPGVGIGSASPMVF